MSETATYHDCEVVKATEKAINVKSPREVFATRDNGYRSKWAWIPRSQLAEGCELGEEGDAGDLVVPNWFAEKEGWK